MPMFAFLLAGAGINSQTSFGVRRTFHGSMAFTLSIPVTRHCLLSMRVGIGLFAFLILLVAVVAMILVMGANSGFPFSLAELTPLAVSLLAGCLVFYSIQPCWRSSWTSFGNAMPRYHYRDSGISVCQLSSTCAIQYFRLMSGEMYLYAGGLPWVAIGSALLTSLLIYAFTAAAIERREF